MSVITFWNDSKGRIGQTSSIIAISAYLAIKRNLKILLLSTGCDDETLKTSFGLNLNSGIATKQNDLSIDAGIQGIYKRVLSNRLTPDGIKNYAKTIYKDRFDIIEGVDSNASADYERIYGTYKEVIDTANKIYDIVFVDLSRGMSEANKIILNRSDLIVVNTEQNINEINKFEELKSIEPILQGNNVLLLLDRCDKDSKYNAKNVSRQIKIKTNALTVLYNTLFNEAMQEGTVDDFILNPLFKKVQENDINAMFFDELQKDIDIIDFKLKELHVRR